MKISSARHLRRREKLQALVEEAKSASNLAALASTPKTHISALLKGNRGVGDELAAKLESVMEKPPGWMDAADEVDQRRAALSDEALAVGALFDSLEPEARARLRTIIDAATGGFATARAEAPELDEQAVPRTRVAGRR
jgi:plasmid maintenance system antidote protein VapI